MLFRIVMIIESIIRLFFPFTHTASLAAVLFPGVFGHLCWHGNIHLPRHSWDQEQNLPRNTRGIWVEKKTGCFLTRTQEDTVINVCVNKILSGAKRVMLASIFIPKCVYLKWQPIYCRPGFDCLSPLKCSTVIDDDNDEWNLWRSALLYFI